MKSKRLPSLSYKLFLTFTISFIIPMLLICILISYIFSNHQYEGIKNQASDSTKLISAYVTKYLTDIDYIMRAPYYHSYFQSKTNLDELTPYELNQLSAELERTLRLTTYSRDDFGDILILSEQKVLFFDTENYYHYLSTSNPLPQRNWYTAAMEKNGKIAITPSDDHCFFISRKLNSLYEPEQENIIMVNMKTNTLDALFSELGSTRHIILFTNDRDELVYSSTRLNSELAGQLSQKTVQYDSDTWVHTSQTMEKYPLTVHVFLSTSGIHQQISAFILVCMGCFFVSLFIAYLLFHGNNKWIKLPVLHIQSVLKEMRHGNLDSRCEPLAVQEFDGIGNSVNIMAERLQEKIKNEYELLIAQKNLQFQALQSQIQPHFIINTIYSFITLNQIGETELLNDAFYSFARLLRYVLSRETNTTLGRELDFLGDYCSLHGIRFGQRLTYQITCTDSLRDFPIPRLLLQPLVENAVIHGVEPSEIPCTLNISAEEHGGTVYLIIEDSGVGFTEEQLLSSTSIGIKNVENRIALWDSRIRLFICRADRLTVQTITIPKDLQEEKDEHTGD